jgi:hypothetical protein
LSSYDPSSGYFANIRTKTGAVRNGLTVMVLMYLGEFSEFALLHILLDGIANCEMI